MKNSFYIVIQLLVVLSNLCGVLAAPSFANASAGLARADSSTTGTTGLSDHSSS